VRGTTRYAYFQDPDRLGCWHRLEWEHAAALGTPFSAEAAGYARRLAASQNRWPDPAQALAELLGRLDQGMVTDRRERRMALRLGAERAALPVPDEPTAQVQPSAAAFSAPGGPCLAVDLDAVNVGGDDDTDEIFDAPDADDFYADAFKVLS